MLVSIDIPERIVARAAALGVPIVDLVAQSLERIEEEPVPAGFVRLGNAPPDPTRGAAMIREIAGRHTLGGLSIKALIEEGRN